MGISPIAMCMFGIPLEKKLINDHCVHYQKDEEIKERNFKLASKLSNEIVSIISHCSSNYPMFFVGISKTYILAPKGYPEPLKFETSDSQHELRKILVKFIKDNNLNVTLLYEESLENSIRYYTFSYTD